MLDEAHNLSDIVLDWVGTTVNADEGKRWGLPEFPVITTGIKNMFSRSAIEPSAQALGWLHQAVNAVGVRLRLLEMRNLNEQVMREKRSATNFLHKLENTIEALNLNPGDHWYIKSGPNLNWRGAGFVCRPLTARIDTSRYFFAKGRVMAMSATIGNVEAFVTELGIKRYDFRIVPNQWEPEARVVDILPVPSMGHAATQRDPKSWDKQADEIAKAIKGLPHDWCGLVLVTRKKEAILLGERLAKRGLQDRIFIMPGADGSYVPTQIQVEQWNAHLAKWPNAICISFSLWEGYDGRAERFVIIAKCFTPDISFLGPSGLKTIDNTNVGDEIFAVTETGEMVVSKVKHVIIQDYSGDIYNIDNTSCSLSVTPNHNMLYTNTYNAEDKRDKWCYKMSEMQDIGTRYFMVPTTANSWQGKELPDKITFTEFFDDNTIIWLRPKVIKKRKGFTNTPNGFKYETNTRMYKANWIDIKSTWIPNSDDKIYFQDKPQCNLIPFFWNSEDLVELIGWFVSEGYSRYNKEYKYSNKITAGETWRIGITQNLGANFDTILALIDRIGIKHYAINAKSKMRDCKDILINSKILYKAFTLWCGIGSRNKKAPRFILDSDSDTLKSFFATLMLGDGSKIKYGDCSVYTTASSELRDQICEIGVKLGYRVSARSHKETYDIALSGIRKSGNIKPKNISIEHYEGKVWCVETEHGTVLAHRDGKFTFTGNCPYPFIADEYERERMNYNAQFFLQRTAYLLEQGAGRCRRGNPDDYNTNGTLNTYVAIADASWTCVEKYLSASMREAIRVN